MEKLVEKIKKDCERALKDNDLNGNLYFSWIEISFFSYLFLIWGISLISLGVIFMAINLLKLYFTIPFIVAGVFVLSLAIFAIVKKTAIKKSKANFTDLLDFSTYYKLAFEEISQQKYQIMSIAKEFTIIPVKFLSQSKKLKSDEVLNFTSGNIKYCYGTITKKYQYPVGPIRISTPTQVINLAGKRYCYLNLHLEQSTDLDLKIVPEKKVKRHLKSQDNTNLQSTDFKRLFSVKTKGQVKTEKFLTSKVMENLVNLSYSHSDRPKIEISNQTITLSFKPLYLGTYWDVRFQIKGIDYKNIKTQLISTMICNQVRTTVAFISEMLLWVEALEIN